LLLSLKMNKAADIAKAVGMATGHFQAGRIAEAETLCRNVLAEAPRNPDALHLLGVIADTVGNHAAAIELIGQAIGFKTNEPFYHGNLGQALQNAGRVDEAVAEYERALKINPGMVAVLINMGNIVMAQGKLDAAEEWYKRAVAADPKQALTHYNLGGLYKAQKKTTPAIAAYTQALALNPNMAEARVNLGALFKDENRFEEAGAQYRQAIALDPKQSKAYNNLGLLLRESGRFDDALECFFQTLKLTPDDTEARANIGTTLITGGAFAEGWPLYEARWEGLSPKSLRPATQLPQWTGENPGANDRLLLFGEQGLGDKIHFSRYISLAAARFPAGVSVITDRSLQSLFRRSFPSVEILAEVPADQGRWQWHCPLMSLPLAFGTTLETVPAQTPYLVPDPVKVAYWKDKIAALTLTARKIGVVWKPGKLMTSASLKALSFQQLKPLLEQPGVAWFSLQKDIDPESEPGRLIDWSAEFNDFDDTAALMMNLDLIISVDTSTAHLAGALNLPVWMLNRHASDWRWLWGRDDSPWYPSMRIFNQKTARDWDEVVGRIITALSK
jgi:Tfp pilus assembly protein PilF